MTLERTVQEDLSQNYFFLNNAEKAESKWNLDSKKNSLPESRQQKQELQTLRETV